MPRNIVCHFAASLGTHPGTVPEATRARQQHPRLWELWEVQKAGKEDAVHVHITPNAKCKSRDAPLKRVIVFERTQKLQLLPGTKHTPQSLIYIPCFSVIAYICLSHWSSLNTAPQNFCSKMTLCDVRLLTSEPPAQIPGGGGEESVWEFSKRQNQYSVWSKQRAGVIGEESRCCLQ